MPRLCALILLAGIVVAAVRRRPAAVVLPDLPDDLLALLRAPCSRTVH